ncbi:MAG: ureidoglycolate lyase [Alphaproteobacteria bacterium]
MTNTRTLTPSLITSEAFAPYGDVIEVTEDGVPFGDHDAQLDLSHGTPRFYIMRLPNRGMGFDRITRHKQVTQCLASVGGADWYIAVAAPSDPPGKEPEPDEIRAFRVPGDVAIKLHLGTWHVGPFFTPAEVGFFNLELADTNIVDHQDCDLLSSYGVDLVLQP